MLLLTRGWIVALVSLLPLAPPQNAAPVTFGMTKEQFWHTPFGTDPRTPLVGDADGDGHADLLSFWPSGTGVIDMARTSPLGKPIYGNVARGNFGKDGIAVACGTFREGKAADLLGVFADGSVRVAWGMAPGTNTYPRDDLAAQIPAANIPKLPIRTGVADFDGDGKLDVLLLGSDGSLVLLQNQRGSDGVPRFTVHPLAGKIANARQFAAGILAGDKRGQCVWLDQAGEVFRALVSADLGPAVPILKASPDDHLVVGRFRGGRAEDILVGQRLLTGGDSKSEITLGDLPTLDMAKSDGPWCAADIDGNGKDDLIRFRRGPERFSGADTYVHFSFDTSESTHGYYCSSNDGLPDLWKTGKVLPGGLNLAELGCKIGHRDVILEIERFENVDENMVKANMARAIKFFADLPVGNPDGTFGITMHVVYRPTWVMSRHDQLRDHFDEFFPPMEHRGIVHTMFAENNGPLVSKVKGDNGRYNGGWHEFVHEVGHQLDLGHEGFWPVSNCVIYPSLMSYTYSYSLNDDGEQVRYSHGDLSSFVINELHVSERLPFPIEKVKFISEGPYYFRIKPTADGKETLVDWNWNGIFGEPDVCADLNYDHGTTFGPRYDIGKTQAGPVLVAVGNQPKPKILLFCGQSLTPGERTLTRSKPGRLVIRRWLGEDRDSEGGKWSDEAVIEPEGVMGDISATYLPKGDTGGDTWVSYPMRDGIVLRSVRLDEGGNPHWGSRQLIPITEGAQGTVAAFHGDLVLLVWRNADTPVGYRLMTASGESLAMHRELPLDLKSLTPVGAVAGAPGSLWVGALATTGPQTGRTEVLRYTLGQTGGLEEAQHDWADGRYAPHRMAMLWRSEPGLGPMGRLYLFSGNAVGPDQPAAQYITMNVPYKDVGGGWLYRRYFNPDFTSIFAPGACFYDGNIVYAIGIHDTDPNRDGTLGVAFYGNGATAVPMGDFDDVTHVQDYGLSRSIPELPK